MIRRILVLAGLSRSLVNFRGPLLCALRDRGHEVIAAAPEDEGAEAVREQLKAQEICFEPVPLARGGLNPVQDFGSLRALQSLLRRQRPDILFAYTAKPVIYGGLAARLGDGVRFFPMITGLGYAFTEGDGPKRRVVRTLVKALYRHGLARAEAVFFQNPDDERLFRDLGLVPNQMPSVRVHGSGVDLEAFAPAALPTEPVFLMLARLVADKGVREYVEAARMVKRRFPEAVFQLGGSMDPNPTGIKALELQNWVDSGVVDYLGYVDLVRPALAGCRFYVLPSYREGTPRSVLEALATGRPVITTDVPGCRETVMHGHNGLLVPPRDASALANAMTQLLEYSEMEIERMGSASLRLAREKYDVNKVNTVILRAMGL